MKQPIQARNQTLDQAFRHPNQRFGAQAIAGNDSSEYGFHRHLVFFVIHAWPPDGSDVGVCPTLMTDKIRGIVL